MESVSNEGEVWVEEPHQVGDLELELVPWVEEQLDPSTRYVISNVKVARENFKL